MTKLDDDLDDFIAGRDELSRQLSALKQPESPAALDAAILASVEKRLEEEQAVRRRPAANLARWRVPLGVAASLIGALLMTMEWQRGAYEQKVDTLRELPHAAPAQPAPVAVARQTEQPPPPAVAEAPVAHRSSASADKALPRKPKAAPSEQKLAEAQPLPAPPPPPPAPAAPPALVASPASVPSPALAIAPAPAPAPALMPAPVMQSPPSRAAAALSKPAPATEMIIAARAARPAAAPPAPPAAPLAMPQNIIANASNVAPTPHFHKPPAMPTGSDPKAEAWLHVIDEMLKADLRQDAREEWRKFRLTYPDYPVPDPLAKRIDLIN